MAGVASPAPAAAAVRQKSSAVAQRAEGVAVAPDESQAVLAVLVVLVVQSLGMISRLAMLMLEPTQMRLPLRLVVMVVLVLFVMADCGRRGGWVGIETDGEGDSGWPVEAQWRRQCRVSALCVSDFDCVWWQKKIMGWPFVNKAL